MDKISGRSSKSYLRNFFPPTSLDKFNLPPPDPNINESRLNHYGIRANVGLDKRKLNWQPRIPDGDGISTSWTIAPGCTGTFAAYVCSISISIRRVFGHAWLTLFGLFKPPREAAHILDECCQKPCSFHLVPARFIVSRCLD